MHPTRFGAISTTMALAAVVALALSCLCATDVGCGSITGVSAASSLAEACVPEATQRASVSQDEPVSASVLPVAFARISLPSPQGFALWPSRFSSTAAVLPLSTPLLC